MPRPTKQQPVSIGPPQLGWMGGIIDMKGRTREQTSLMRRHPQCILVVETGQLPVVQRLARLTGTRPTITQGRPLSKSLRRGCSEHCPEPHEHFTPTLPTIGRWYISGAAAAVVLEALLEEPNPYLTVDVTERIEFLGKIKETIPADGRGRHAVNKSIERMRKLGWEIPGYLDA